MKTQNERKKNDTNSKELTGVRSGSVVALHRTEKRFGSQIGWMCACDCGRQLIVRSSIIAAGRIKSCGCRTKQILRECRTTHGHSKTGSRTYATWKSMLERCHLESHKSYFEYGGRGITVCDDWRNDFGKFLADMGERPSGTTIDRINNDLGYFKDNCRWVSAKQQARNRRSNRMLSAFGRTMTAAAWCELFGISQDTLSVRIDRLGWEVEKAITCPVKRQKNNRVAEYHLQG